jgi:hypothetical protein
MQPNLRVGIPFCFRLPRRQSGWRRHKRTASMLWEAMDTVHLANDAPAGFRVVYRNHDGTTVRESQLPL